MSVAIQSLVPRITSIKLKGTKAPNEPSGAMLEGARRVVNVETSVVRLVPAVRALAAVRDHSLITPEVINPGFVQRVGPGGA